MATRLEGHWKSLISLSEPSQINWLVNQSILKIIHKCLEAGVGNFEHNEEADILAKKSAAK